MADKLLLSRLAISIHALLAESDQRQAYNYTAIAEDFYPRSPCGERPSRDMHR